MIVRPIFSEICRLASNIDVITKHAQIKPYASYSIPYFEEYNYRIQPCPGKDPENLALLLLRTQQVK